MDLVSVLVYRHKCLYFSQYDTILITIMFRMQEVLAFRLSSSFFKIVLANLSPTHFHMNFRISSLVSAKKAVEILMMIVFNMYIYLGILLTILTIPICEHRTVLILFMCSLVSFYYDFLIFSLQVL